LPSGKEGEFFAAGVYSYGIRPKQKRKPDAASRQSSPTPSNRPHGQMSTSEAGLRGESVQLLSRTVVIDKPVAHAVYGNGDLPDGELTGDLPANALAPNNNTVRVLPGGSMGDVAGGLAYTSSSTGTATAAGNRVIMCGGTVGANVCGGMSGNDSGTNSVTTTSTGNSVTISGGIVSGYAFGGDSSTVGNASTAIATGNSVTISGGSVGLSVFGGNSMNRSGTAVISPFLGVSKSRAYAACLSFIAGVIPPMPMLGRSLLYVQSHAVANSCISSSDSKRY
jgi:hypothetical protein